MTNRKPPAIFRSALNVALIVTLKEAEEYLDEGEDLAALGTLISLDDLVADLNAALRLYRRNRSRKPGASRTLLSRSSAHL